MEGTETLNSPRPIHRDGRYIGRIVPMPSGRIRAVRRHGSAIDLRKIASFGSIDTATRWVEDGMTDEQAHEHGAALCRRLIDASGR